MCSCDVETNVFMLLRSMFGSDWSRLHSTISLGQIYPIAFVRYSSTIGYIYFSSFLWWFMSERSLWYLRRKPIVPWNIYQQQGNCLDIAFEEKASWMFWSFLHLLVCSIITKQQGKLLDVNYTLIIHMEYWKIVSRCFSFKTLKVVLVRTSVKDHLGLIANENSLKTFVGWFFWH